MKTVLCLLIVCLTFVIIVKMFIKDNKHDLEIKIGESYFNIKKHEKE